MDDIKQTHPEKPRTKRVTKCATVQPQLAASAKNVTETVQKRAKGKVGQPSKFTQEKWEAILEHIATYGDLIEICSKPDMPAVSTVRRWYREKPELWDDIRQAWMEASFLGHSVNTNILRGGVLSTGDFRRDEALVKANMWHMGKTNRRDFGDKTLVEVAVHEPFVIEGWMLPGQVIEQQAIEHKPDTDTDEDTSE